MRALATWSGAIAGLLLILVGSLIPAAVLVPVAELPPRLLSLPSTWQVPALLLCALVCGPRSGVMAAVAYITVGLVDLPVFHDGGGLGYVLTPAFGYLAGFVPAAWLTGRLAHQEGMNDLARLTLAGLAGVVTIQLCGILNLLLGAGVNRWSESLPDLLFSYSLGPLLAQLALCVAIALIALPIRRLLWIE